MRPIHTFMVAAAMLGAMAPTPARALSYVSPGRRADSAIVEDEDRRPRELQKGDVLPELGEVRTIDEDEVVFERILSDDERDKLKAEGLLAPDARRFRLYRRPGPQAPE